MRTIRIHCKHVPDYGTIVARRPINLIYDEQICLLTSGGPRGQQKTAPKQRGGLILHRGSRHINGREIVINCCNARRVIDTAWILNSVYPAPFRKLCLIGDNARKVKISAIVVTVHKIRCNVHCNFVPLEVHFVAVWVVASQLHDRYRRCT